MSTHKHTFLIYHIFWGLLFFCYYHTVLSQDPPPCLRLKLLKHLYQSPVLPKDPCPASFKRISAPIQLLHIVQLSPDLVKVLLRNYQFILVGL